VVLRRLHQLLRRPAAAPRRPLDNAAYLKLLNKTINQVMQTPGRLVQSVAQASMDAWVKYYRQDENTPNATVSYYTKGALVALCFDLTLRGEGRTTLDEVMRSLWVRCQAGPMTEADFATVLAELSGRSFEAEIEAWVHGRGELPLKDLLAGHGVTVHEDAAQLAQRLGLRVSETHGVAVKMVLRGGAAEQAGFAAGMTYEAITVRTEAGKVGIVTLNRPKQLNALNDQLMDELGQALKAFDADEAIGCIIVTGSEKAFAAGADIAAMARYTFADVYKQRLHHPQLGDHPQHPQAGDRRGERLRLGGGCELAMMCDFIIAADNAKFGQPEIKLGIIPGAGGTQRLPRAVGKSKAMDMVLTGRMMDAQEAERAGLVSRVVPLDKLMDEALGAALMICDYSQIAVMAAKESVNRAFESGCPTA
jgi:enoyl-CoA hydratase